MNRPELRFTDTPSMPVDKARELVKELAHVAYDRPEGTILGEAFDAENLIKCDGVTDKAVTAWRIDLEGGFTIVIGLLEATPGALGCN